MSSGLVVLSGGLDSAVCLALARDEHEILLAVTFDYGQRHRIELGRAATLAGLYGAEHLVVRLDLSAWGGSALTDSRIDVPAAAPAGSSESAASTNGAERVGGAEAPGSAGIPVTYVPARNLIFLSVATGIAEAREADAIYLGVNALDYSGYPDCRPEFIAAFRTVAALGLKRGVEGNPVDIRTPLIDRSKAEIVGIGRRLGAPLHLTWSCYGGGPLPCRQCDACSLRAKGFAEAGVVDEAPA
ncbi:MAG TPA: 7-cyano-7-deazaguanine synthase QueC [Acidimicrobiales bacterium]|nr:7-cyano-7-deazaguanine synthase QueC [Acidimicrobiales bacterium]